MNPQKFAMIWIILIGLCFVTTAIATEEGTWVPLKGSLGSDEPEVTVLESNAEHTIIRLEIPGYYSEEITGDGQTYQIPRIPNAGFLGEVGGPELPAITHLVAIPNTGSFDVGILSENTTNIPGYPVYPLQDISEERYPDVSIYKDLDIYNQDDIYPISPVHVSDPMIMRDLRVVAITWYPIRTNPLHGGITATNSIEIEIRPNGDTGINEKHSQLSRMTPGFYKLYKKNILNFDELYDESLLTPGSILIICNDNTQVTSRLQILVNWKKRKGYTVTLATTAQTGTTGSSIKAYIQTAYNTWNPPLEYVILAGDADNGTFNIPVYTSSTYDHGYTQLDGTDLISDVAIGRLSYDDLNTLDNIINKTVSYESNPYMGQTAWYTKAYLLAGTSYAYSPVLVSRYIRSLLYQAGISNVTIREYSGSIPASDLRNYVNAGTLFMNYRGSWISEMVCSNFQGQLTNGYMLPVAVCITCNTGTFTSGEAVSECWLREGTQTTPAGAVACIGTATSGTYTRFNNVVNTGIFYGLFTKELYNFGVALVEGKIQFLNAFPGDLTHQQDFSWWNNLMGDPSLECWTGIPQTMAVTNPSQIIVGQNSLTVTVRDASNNPISGALVCLLKDGETFITQYTDATGQLTLPITATTTGTMKVTVTKHDYRPYLANLNVVSGEIVSPISWIIDDDNIPPSQGNSNGIVNPGEIIELSIKLKNWGSNAANNVTGRLIETDPFLTVNRDSANYRNIAPGDTTWSSTNYLMTVSGNCPDNHLLTLSIQVNASGRPSYTSLVPIVVRAANLSFSSRTLSNVGANGRFDPGETGNISVTLNNIGGFNATNVTGILKSSHYLAVVTDSIGSFGTIAPSGTGNNNSDLFTVAMNNYIFPGQPVTFTVLLNGTGGFGDTVSFNEKVGTAAIDDPTGPDSYGYWAFENTDSTYAKRPSYSWIEINPNVGGHQYNGTLIPLSDYSEDQDDSEVIPVPFTFRYYGQSFTQITVCSNGWLAMGSQADQVQFRNLPIPGGDGPIGQVAAFWDDLVLSSGNVYYYYDSSNHRFIVEWSQLRTRVNNALETLEAILYDPAYRPTPTGDGEILVQYQTVNNVTGASDDIDYATVGIESNSQLDGIQYTYWNAYPSSATGLANGRAILFTTDTGFIGPQPDSIGPEITHTPLGNTTDPTGPYGVTAYIWDLSGVDHANLHYSGNGITFINLSMVNSSGNDWVSSIPGQAPGTTVYYFISAVDDSENYAQTDTFSFQIYDVIYLFDVESGEAGWTHHTTGTWIDQWHISTEDYHSGSHAWKCGDTGTGNYGNFDDSYLESPVLQLPANSTLHFWHDIQSEVSPAFPDSAYDAGVMQISINGGVWTQLTPTGGYSRVTRCTAGGGNPYTGPFACATPCWAGTINWTEVTADLSAYQGPCQIRFRFGTDQAVGAEGWYIDDFAIVGLPQGSLLPPNHVVIQKVSSNILITWSPVFGASAYTIFHASTPEPAVWDSLSTVNEPSTSFQHSNALNNSLGFYRIIARN
jgi:hypothetical protein